MSSLFVWLTNTLLIEVLASNALSVRMVSCFKAASANPVLILTVRGSHKTNSENYSSYA